MIVFNPNTYIISKNSDNLAVKAQFLSKKYPLKFKFGLLFSSKRLRTFF